MFCHKDDGKLFHTWTSTPKLMLPKLLCVHRMTHVLSNGRKRLLSQTRLISSDVQVPH